MAINFHLTPVIGIFKVPKRAIQERIETDAQRKISELSENSVKAGGPGYRFVRIDDGYAIAEEVGSTRTVAYQVHYGMS